jgi:hypothetical protein
MRGACGIQMARSSIGVFTAPHASAKNFIQRVPAMTVKPLFAWYDFWVGVFWDRESRKLYVLPLPCIGVVIQFK